MTQQYFCHKPNNAIKITFDENILLFIHLKKFLVYFIVYFLFYILLL